MKCYMVRFTYKRIHDDANASRMSKGVACAVRYVAAESLDDALASVRQKFEGAKIDAVAYQGVALEA